MKIIEEKLQPKARKESRLHNTGEQNITEEVPIVLKAWAAGTKRELEQLLPTKRNHDDALNANTDNRWRDQHKIANKAQDRKQQERAAKGTTTTNRQATTQQHDHW